MLAAHGMGLGICPIGFAWPLLEQTDVKCELNIPEDSVPVLPIIVGYPRQPAQTTERKEPKILCWQ
jgi:nitroreductase